MSDTTWKVGAAVTLIAILVAAFINYPRPTVEEMQAKAELERIEAEATALELQLEYELEQKAKAEEHQRYLEREAAKPVEQKVEESSTDMGEAVVGAAAIGAGAWIFTKMLEGI